MTDDKGLGQGSSHGDCGAEWTESSDRTAVTERMSTGHGSSWIGGVGRGRGYENDSLVSSLPREISEVPGTKQGMQKGERVCERSFSFQYPCYICITTKIW